MPSPMMKTNSMTDCSREKTGLHVCKKSSKISKNSFSHIKNSRQEATCDLHTSNELDDSFCDKVIVQEVRSGVANCCDLPAEESQPEKHRSTSDHVATICRMDQKQANGFPTVETIFSPILESINGDNEPNAHDDGGSEKGLDLPSLGDKESDDRSKNSCEYRSYNLSDFFISDMIEINSANGDFTKASCIPDYSCDESNRFFYDEYMLLPSLEDSIESSNGYDDNKFWLEPAIISEESLDLAIHQLRSSKEEPDVNSYPDWDPAECLDPQTFIRNLPDLSELPHESRQTRSITLVLDLDETLVHSSTELCDDADFTITVFSNLQERTMYVKKRPYLKEFLERVSKMFQIIVFTASQSIYANQLLDILDPDGTIINFRAFRESCIFENGCYIKDLTVLGIDLAKVAIIDNCPEVFRLQINNGIPIKSWYNDPSDRSLISLLPFLETLVDAEDVRPLIARKFGNKE